MKKNLFSIIIYMFFLFYVSFWFGVVVGKNKDKIILKYKNYYKLMCKWICLDRRGIYRYLLDESVNSVAIYGKADMGKLLYRQVCDRDIEVKYFIEKRQGEEYNGIPTYGIESFLPDVDAIIVTPFLEFDEIVQKLTDKTNCRIISIEEVINNAAE